VETALQGGGSIHNVEKCSNTKTHHSLGDKVNGALTEVKMSRMRKRSEVDQEKKTYQSGDRVTVLGLECRNDQTS
jgi:hypothetical protein